MSGHQHQLSMDREFRYILQWFGEWSEIQREDFVPVLLECLACEADAATAADAVEVLPINGNVLTAGLAAASLSDKPMSLFQCRVKLFREWSAKWPADLKQMLRDKCQQIDVEWSDRFASELAGELAAVVNAANGHAAVAAADLAGVVDELALAVAAAGADNDEQHAIVHGVIVNGDAGGDEDDDVDVNVRPENGVIADHQHDRDDVDVAAVQPQLSPAMNLQNGPVVSA